MKLDIFSIMEEIGDFLGFAYDCSCSSYGIKILSIKKSNSSSNNQEVLEIRFSIIDKKNRVVLDEGVILMVDNPDNPKILEFELK